MHGKCKTIRHYYKLLDIVMLPPDVSKYGWMVVFVALQVPTHVCWYPNFTSRYAPFFKDFIYILLSEEMDAVL